MPNSYDTVQVQEGDPMGWLSYGRYTWKCYQGTNHTPIRILFD